MGVGNMLMSFTGWNAVRLDLCIAEVVLLWWTWKLYTAWIILILWSLFRISFISTTFSDHIIGILYYVQSSLFCFLFQVSWFLLLLRASRLWLQWTVCPVICVIKLSSILTFLYLNRFSLSSGKTLLFYSKQ